MRWSTCSVAIASVFFLGCESPGLSRQQRAVDEQTVQNRVTEWTNALNNRAVGRWVGAISSVYALAQFVFAPVLGALSDRFGRRPVILMSLFGLGVDYLIMGFAPTLGWLFVGRTIAGVMGASYTTANAYIADVSTPANRAQNFGLVGAAFGLGFIFGPALGGLLGGIDLRLPFFASAALALLNWMYGYFVLPESLPPEERDAFSLRKANPFLAHCLAVDRQSARDVRHALLLRQQMLDLDHDFPSFHSPPSFLRKAC